MGWFSNSVKTAQDAHLEQLQKQSAAQQYALSQQQSISNSSLAQQNCITTASGLTSSGLMGGMGTITVGGGSTASQILMGGNPYQWNQAYTPEPAQTRMDKNEIIVRAYMNKYGISNEKYEQIYQTACTWIGDAILKSKYPSYTTEFMLYEFGEKEMGKLNFNNDIEEIIK